MKNMFRIDEMTRGRFGNKILHYNTLMQLAESNSCETSCVPWEGSELFDDLSTYKDPKNSETKVSWDEILENIKLDVSSTDYQVDPYSLHNNFWKVTKTDPRKFFKINEKHKRNLPKEKTNIGIHLRGTDILGADGNNGREIHEPKYYIDSINLCEKEFDNTKYYVCTDDLNFVSFIETVKHLESNNIEFELGSPNHYMDFSTLSECDVLIASSSTFVVCAGFIGKKNKKIIHSRIWLDKNINHTSWHTTPDPEHVRKWQLSFDSFWVDLYNSGGNNFYEMWKIV